MDAYVTSRSGTLLVLVGWMEFCAASEVPAVSESSAAC
jgi:hypothetical protein